MDCLHLHPNLSPHCPGLVFLSLRATPRSQLKSYFLHEAIPHTATPLSFLVTVWITEGGGEREKPTHSTRSPAP